MSVEDTIIGLIGGFAISVVTFYVGMQIQRRAERKGFLREHVRRFYPILRELATDLSYAISTKLHDNPDPTSLADVLSKMSKEFDSYTAAYLELRKGGLEPELESSDKNTADELKGLYVLWKLESSSAFAGNFEPYLSKVIICRNLVEAYLRGKWWRV
jgi:hypothetical protein